MSKNKNLKLILISLLTILCISGVTSTSQAHILIIGDSNSDIPDFYTEALQLANDLKARGYPVVELYRENATSENILKGMYNADAVIYVGHGGYQTGHYDMNGGTATPPFALVGSDEFVWGINDKMREGWDANLFYAPYKSNIPVFLLHACFSTGWVEDKQVANPIETIYNFAHMFTGSGANYYATAWNGAEIIYDFLNGAANFQVANNQNYEKIITSTLYNGTLVWRNNNGYAAFVGDWNGTFPTVAQTTVYNGTAAEAWYNSDRQIHRLTCNFTTNPTTKYSGQQVNFTDKSTDIGSFINTYFWNFGDGTTSTAANTTHVYSTPGNYIVTHTVTDNYGLVAQINQTISILGNNSALYVNALLGNDTWDGTSPTWISGTMGPVKTIQKAVNTITTGGKINVSSGVYTENVVINKTLSLIAGGNGTVTVNPSQNSSPIFTLTSSGSGSTVKGFNLNGSSNSAIYLDKSINNTIMNNTINGLIGTGNTLWGIAIVNCNGRNIIIGNNVSNCQEGINLYNSSNILITNNTLANSIWDNVALTLSSSNNITTNFITGSDSGIRLIENSNQNRIMANNLTGNIWTSISLVNSHFNSIINGNQLSDCQEGMYLYSSWNNNITNNTAENNIWDGIAIHDSSNNTIENNTQLTTNNCGIYLIGASNNNKIQKNTLNNNLWAGVGLSQADNNRISNNTINNNKVGIHLFQSASNNTITQNNITGNSWDGVDVLEGSNSNTFTGNNIQNSYYGVRILNSNENNLNQNNFAGNTVQGYDNTLNGNNWDNGTTGNYYSDWSSTDPRPINGGYCVDNYPSTIPF